jgi:DNA-binding LacI/PurR family transcriptional regulator
MIRKISNISTIKDVAEKAAVSATTIAQPKRQLWETGAQLLLQRIRKGERPKSTIFLEAPLVKRQSSAILRSQQ